MINWRAGETEYKFSLKTQIDRVAQMFSQRIYPAGHSGLFGHTGNEGKSGGEFMNRYEEAATILGRLRPEQLVRIAAALEKR